MVKILNFETSEDVFIRQLSWSLQYDRVLLFHEKRRMVPKLYKACALNEKTMGGTKQNGILKGDQRLCSLHITY
jgi:hypothetical protein